MTAASDELVEKGRGVSIVKAAARLGLRFRPRGVEHPRPCAVKGGKDRFFLQHAEEQLELPRLRTGRPRRWTRGWRGDP